MVATNALHRPFSSLEAALDPPNPGTRNLWNLWNPWNLWNLGKGLQNLVFRQIFGAQRRAGDGLRDDVATLDLCAGAVVRRDRDDQ